MISDLPQDVTLEAQVKAAGVRVWAGKVVLRTIN
jgi:hypothetical protein